MLVAERLGQKIIAAEAERLPDYVCPACRRLVILKRGRRVIAHFAHKPPTTCEWAKGETRAHLEAKQIVYDALRSRGVTVALEHVIDTLPGDRRADVLAWFHQNDVLAIELQHTSIGSELIEARSQSYARANVAQLWIPFLSEAALRQGELRTDGTLFVNRYSPRPFERWVHGLNGKDGMWMYAPSEKAFRLAHMTGHQIFVEERSWFEQGGVEASAGGYYRWSKRYRDLVLSRSYTIQELNIEVRESKKSAQGACAIRDALSPRRPIFL